MQSATLSHLVDELSDHSVPLLGGFVDGAKHFVLDLVDDILEFEDFLDGVDQVNAVALETIAVRAVLLTMNGG